MTTHDTYTLKGFVKEITTNGVAYGPDSTRYMVTMIGDSLALEVIAPDRKEREHYFSMGVPFRTLQDVQDAAISMVQSN